ncbi:MAG: methylenetetrahydrofolate reductase [Opitutaceae bacterium]|nr:methylenetetrahydrofolate reductase [Cytophagales bacterium]
MKITEYLSRSTETLFSFEILPPLKGDSIQTIFDGIDPLMEFKPKFVDVTYHREEFAYKNNSDGTISKMTIRKRPGTVGICAGIMNRYKVDAVPHVLCGGFTKEETENMLLDLHFLGIDNVLVLRGDPVKSEGIFNPHPDGYCYATELLEAVENMNKGIYQDSSLISPSPTNFCTGVAAYPEKHFEAASFESDMKFLKMKQDMGADYIVTQMFFDNTKYFEWVKSCRENGITIPIIPGLKPLTTKKQMDILPKIFYLHMPDEFKRAVHEAKDDNAAKEIGIEWCIQQSKELMAAGAPVLHYYTMSKSQAVKKICEAIF